MDLKEIKRIIDLVENAKISSLAIENKDLKIEVKKELSGYADPRSYPIHSVPHQVVHAQLTPEQKSGDSTDQKVSEPKPDANLVAITSPMVGTFYLTPTPDADPYVKVGDKISPHQVVCIIEAMKIFNEIESEVAGVIEQICVENGSAVEYGQKLFLIKK